MKSGVKCANSLSIQVGEVSIHLGGKKRVFFLFQRSFFKPEVVEGKKNTEANNALTEATTEVFKDSRCMLDIVQAQGVTPAGAGTSPSSRVSKLLTMKGQD